MFLAADGSALPPREGGFDAVLGNPPYVSTQSQNHPDNKWLPTLLRRWGYSNDLYVIFTDLGFRILRDGGRFGFIVSDTFFTLASKADFRALLHEHRLDVVGQCDPFDATVDAAIFVAEKSSPPPDHQTLFVQARPRWREDGKRSQPEKALPLLPDEKIAWSEPDPPGSEAGVVHGTFRDLRLHRAPSALWRSAHKAAFFEPRPGTIRLWEKFNAPVCALVGEWWERIATSEKFAENRPLILDYTRTVKPGEITLLGLIAEGGQGLATANNARFLGYLEDTNEARVIVERRVEWTKKWLADAAIATVFRQVLTDAGGDEGKPLKDSPAWESCVEPLRQQFGDPRLGIRKTDLYRIVSRNLLAGDDDFRFAWTQRKAELLARWRTHEDLRPFWNTTLGLDLSRNQLEKLHKAKNVMDTEFITLCRDIQLWAAGPPNGKRRASRGAIGLRSNEDYTDADDAPRIAAIYRGLGGRGRFVPFRKGDPAGNLWLEAEPLFVEWTQENVAFLFENSGRRAPQMPVMRNPEFFLRPGVSWTRGANHVPIKVKMLEPAIMDVNAMKLSPLPGGISAEFLVALMNSNVFSFFLKRFIAHTWMAQISDLRMMPLVIPTLAQAQRLERVAELAMAAKRHAFASEPPDNALVAECRRLAEQLTAHAPGYLRPPAQAVTFQKPDDCLAVIERAVNWEAEKLYGVESLGPFDDF